MPTTKRNKINYTMKLGARVYWVNFSLNTLSKSIKETGCHQKAVYSVLLSRRLHSSLHSKNYQAQKKSPPRFN